MKLSPRSRLNELIVKENSGKKTSKELIPLYNNAIVDLSNQKGAYSDPYYIQIWIRFLYHHFRNFSSKDIVFPYLKYLRLNNIGRKNSLIYIIQALFEESFEGDSAQCLKYLKEGESEKAQPLVFVEKAIRLHQQGKFKSFNFEKCLEDYYTKKEVSSSEKTVAFIRQKRFSLNDQNPENANVNNATKESMSIPGGDRKLDSEDEEDNILEDLRRNISSTFDSHFGNRKSSRHFLSSVNSQKGKRRGSTSSITDSSTLKKLALRNDSMTGKKRVRRPAVVTEIEPKKKKRKLFSSAKDSVIVNGKGYKKLGLLGKGGSSKVLKCLSGSNEIVAIKRVRLSGPPTIVRSFINEVKILQQLQGEEHIIKLIDSEICNENKILFLVMECGEVDLNVLLKRRQNQPLNLNLIRVYWQQMLEAVHNIHMKRIVHGDLKPANFLLVKGNLKLIDFGIAKRIQHDNTTNIVRDAQVGTLNYISPEALVENKDMTENPGDPKYKVGRSSDIWSLGCILYQMTSGVAPFAHLSMVKKLHAITNEHHVIQFSKQIPKEIVDILSKTLRRNPLRRPTIPELLAHPFLQPTTVRESSTDITRREAAMLLNRNSQVLLSQSYTYSQKEVFASKMIEAVQKNNMDVKKIIRMRI